MNGIFEILPLEYIFVFSLAFNNNGKTYKTCKVMGIIEQINPFSGIPKNFGREIFSFAKVYSREM